MRLPVWATVCGTALLVGLGAGLWARGATQPNANHRGEDPAQPENAPPRESATPDAASVKYLVVGGGATPESTEVSLEQDVQLVVDTLEGPGRVLFAGGSASMAVRQLAPELQAPSLLRRVGDLFQPRAGRGSRYRRPKLDAARSTEGAARVLAELLRAGSRPLLLFVAAHGEQGRERADNFIPLWGGESLTVRELSEQHDTSSRPLRVVVAACFAGGFAELAFAGADPERGTSHAPRCGLFAGTWDRETTGCDPDPDRRAQEGYSLHMLHALRGHDRDGRALEAAAIDFDGDGNVSLLEAHTRARIASVSFDVPTTTSERYLRSLELAGADAGRVEHPEESAVIDQLGERLAARTYPAAQALWQRRDQALAELDVRLAEAETTLEQRFSALSAELLGRWPVLGDAYHPDFAKVLERNARSILEVLDRSPQAQAYYAAEKAVGALDAAYWDARVGEARALRLLRAHENLRMVAALRKTGGSRWQGYQRLLECERGAP